MFTIATGATSWPLSQNTEVNVENDGSIASNGATTASFVNLHSMDMDIYWDDGQYGKIVATFEPPPKWIILRLFNYYFHSNFVQQSI